MTTLIFDALPGVETPVGEVTRALAAMWDSNAPEVAAASSDSRASQMNLVVHFGLDSTAETARAGFATALNLAQRHPCRIIALCPRTSGEAGGVGAKIYCECFLGAAGSPDLTCIEAVVLTYALTQRRYLEDQASIMLESDLPLYFWPQRLQVARRLEDYQFFLREANRIVVDSAVEKPGFSEIAWPRPEAVRDLALARTLPIRQSMGHFLSYIPPVRICSGLTRVEVRHPPPFAAEAAALTRWLKQGVEDCAAQAGAEAVAARFECKAGDGPDGVVGIHWEYGGDGRMDFALDLVRKHAELSAFLGGERISVNSAVRLLAPEQALAEALFF